MRKFSGRRPSSSCSSAHRSESSTSFSLSAFSLAEDSPQRFSRSRRRIAATLALLATRIATPCSHPPTDRRPAISGRDAPGPERSPARRPAPHAPRPGSAGRSAGPSPHGGRRSPRRRFPPPRAPRAGGRQTAPAVGRRSGRRSCPPARVLRRCLWTDVLGLLAIRCCPAASMFALECPPTVRLFPNSGDFY